MTEKAACCLVLLLNMNAMNFGVTVVMRAVLPKSRFRCLLFVGKRDRKFVSLYKYKITSLSVTGENSE